MCRPVSQGRLGIRDLLHTSMAMLTKWVCRLMQPSDDLVFAVLRGGYGPLLDWEIWQSSMRGDSAFMSNVRRCLMIVQRFFRPQLGNGETFRFWLDDWSGNGRLCRAFPRLFRLSTEPRVRCGGLGTIPGFWRCPRH